MDKFNILYIGNVATDISYMKKVDFGLPKWAVTLPEGQCKDLRRGGGKVTIRKKSGNRRQ